jgi:hypothetical protein
MRRAIIMKKIIAALAGWLASTVTEDWALRRGLERRLASLLAWMAGAAASTAVLRT